MEKRKLTVILAVIFSMLILIFGIIFIVTRPTLHSGSKQISVTVVFRDKSQKEYSIKTDAEFLAEALLEEKIISEKSVDGLYTVIAGERADYSLDKSWWCLTKNGEMVNNGINDQALSDGESYEITNTPS